MQLPILLLLVSSLSAATAKTDKTLPTLIATVRASLPDHVTEHAVTLRRSDASRKIAQAKAMLHNMTGRLEKRLKKEEAPDRLVVCLGVPEKLRTFVEARKVAPLTSAIRSLVSTTYHRLSVRSSLLVKKHGLRLDETKTTIVLQHVVAAIGMSKIVLSNATGSFGRAVVAELRSLNHSLSTRQRATVASSFSTWLFRKHHHLQHLLSRVLRQHSVRLSRPEVEEVVTHVLREIPVTAVAPRSPRLTHQDVLRSVVGKIGSLRALTTAQERVLTASISRRLHAFVAHARIEVDELLRKHHVLVSGATLDRLMRHIGAQTPRVMNEVHRFLHHESRRVLARIRAQDAAARLNASHVEAYVRDMVRTVNVLVARLAHRNVSALFMRHNVTADDNALFQLVHQALLERAGVRALSPRELRMRVRMEMPYVRALALADEVKRELRREVARVAEVVRSEVEVLSMDDRTRVRFRVVARGFDPREAEERIRTAVAHRRFSILVGGQRVFAAPPPALGRPVADLPWSILIGAAAATALVLLLLTVAAVVVAIRRRHRMDLNAEDSSDVRPGISKIPYAKVHEPDAACA